MRACLMCGEPIPETRPGNRTIYCSLKCARKAETERRKEYLSGRAKRHNGIALYVYSAYSCKCALCGWQATPELLKLRGKWQYGHGNEIHHITPVQEGGTDEWNNIILLCPNHHKAADLGLIDREELRAHTKPYRLSDDETRDAISRCADAVAASVFEA